jgi:uncharacterized heparinase superfamily protein
MDFTGYRKGASTSANLIGMFDVARPTPRSAAKLHRLRGLRPLRRVVRRQGNRDAIRIIGAGEQAAGALMGLSAEAGTTPRDCPTGRRE